MKKVIFYHDEVHPRTGKTKRSWRSLQHTFKSVESRTYIKRFRSYITAGGTKRQRLEEIESFTFSCFEKARALLLSVHEVDIKD